MNFPRVSVLFGCCFLVLDPSSVSRFVALVTECGLCVVAYCGRAGGQKIRLAKMKKATNVRIVVGYLKKFGISDHVKIKTDQPKLIPVTEHKM